MLTSAYLSFTGALVAWVAMTGIIAPAPQQKDARAKTGGGGRSAASKPDRPGIHERLLWWAVLIHPTDHGHAYAARFAQ